MLRRMRMNLTVKRRWRNMHGRSCIICGMAFAEFGHDAEPIRKGRCCNKCNFTVVIPARLRRAREQLVHEKAEADRQSIERLSAPPQTEG